MGPLEGFKIIEIAGIGPVPFCGMLLSDLGAEVIRVDKMTPGPIGGFADPKYDIMGRGRRSIAVDLKKPDGRAAVLRLIDDADALMEGFRPGVAEKLGIGPEECMARNSRLVYGRMTGWGQEGPLARAAGHDINYISLAGALHGIGRAGEAPVPPLNLVGDFGGGALYLAMGMLAALLEASRSGKGQIVDTAMIDGAASLMSVFHGLHALGYWLDERGSNLLDTGSHFYDVYETADGKYVSIGSAEPQFYAELLERLGLAGEDLPGQLDRDEWPAMSERLAAIFKTKTREQWCELLEGTDVCFAPVLSLAEAHEHPHMKQRGTFTEIEGVRQPAPAPRFSRTPSAVQGPAVRAGEHTDEVLAALGFSEGEIADLRASGAVAGPIS